MRSYGQIDFFPTLFAEPFNWIITLWFLINWSAIYFIKSIANLLPSAGRAGSIGKANPCQAKRSQAKQQNIESFGIRCKWVSIRRYLLQCKLHNNQVIMHSRCFSLRKMQICINMINAILLRAISISPIAMLAGLTYVCTMQTHFCFFILSSSRLVYCSITAIENGILRRRGKHWTLPIAFCVN